MKKFLNDPNKFVPEMHRGRAPRQPGPVLAGARVPPDLSRKDRPGRFQGLGDPGFGLGPRAGARHDGGPRHARRAPARARCSPPRRSMPATSLYRRRSKSDAGVLVLINNYQGDKMAWDMAIELAEADGHQGRGVHHQRRRRRAGQHLFDRPPRRGRQLLRHQGPAAPPPRRAQEPGRVLEDRRQGQQPGPHDRRGPHVLRPAAEGRAPSSTGRRRDRSRRRHPWRARPPPRQDQVGRRDHRRDVRRHCRPTCRSSRATASPSWSTASAARRSASSMSCIAASPPARRAGRHD
jgi:hypothetical protein